MRCHLLFTRLRINSDDDDDDVDGRDTQNKNDEVSDDSWQAKNDDGNDDHDDYGIGVCDGDVVTVGKKTKYKEVKSKMWLSPLFNQSLSPPPTSRSI